MSEDTVRIPEITSVEVLALKPGDTLICTVKGRIESEMKEYLMRTLKERFGIENKIMVVENDLKFEVLRKTE